jgi:aryl-alcohol dehydrogenase-like predicted oxidoreductase
VPCRHADTALTRYPFCQPAAVPTEAATQGRTDAYIASWLAKDKARRGKIVLATKVAGASERITWLRDGNKARHSARSCCYKRRSCARWA